MKIRKMMKSRRKKRILIARAIKFAVNSILFTGLFILLGSIGAIEVGRIEFHQFIVQCIIGLALIVFYRYTRYRIYEEEEV